jgi:trimethylamine-N-oxide reductase (cytochrome c)
MGHFASQVAAWYTDLGIPCVYISPDCNYQNASHPGKWIPVLANTDVALQLACIYTWFVEDTYDKDYVATHVKSGGLEKLKAYIMGNEDGIPKTPEWASPRCGVPEWTIKALARQIASKATSYLHVEAGPFARGPYSHEPARYECIMLACKD